MKTLNLIVGICLIAAMGWAMTRSVAPPDDFWFQSVVTESERPVLLKFGADWCGPCRQTDQALDHAVADLNGRVKIVRIDVDQRPELARHYGIRAIPRVMLLEHGKVITSRGGFADGDDVVNWVHRFTKSQSL